MSSIRVSVLASDWRLERQYVVRIMYVSQRLRTESDLMEPGKIPQNASRVRIPAKSVSVPVALEAIYKFFLARVHRKVETIAALISASTV